MLSNISFQLLNMRSIFSPSVRFIFAILIGCLAYGSIFFIYKFLELNIKHFNLNLAMLASIDIIYLCYGQYRAKKKAKLDEENAPETQVDNDSTPQVPPESLQFTEPENDLQEPLQTIPEGTNEAEESPRKKPSTNEFPSQNNTTTPTDEANFVETNQQGQLIES